MADLQINLVSNTTGKHRAMTSPNAFARSWRQSLRIRRARRRSRGATRSACAANSGRRSLRPLGGSTARPGPRNHRDLQTNARRGGCGWYIESDQPKARFVIDKGKAALHGISAETISQTLRLAVGGDPVDLLHVPHEKEDINIVLQLPRSLRTRPEELLALRVCSGDANALPEPGSVTGTPPLIPMRELVHIEDPRYRKPLSQKPYARDIRHRRRRGRGRKPRLCDLRHEQSLANSTAASSVGAARRSRSITLLSPSPTQNLR